MSEYRRRRGYEELGRNRRNGGGLGCIDDRLTVGLVVCVQASQRIGSADLGDTIVGVCIVISSRAGHILDLHRRLDSDQQAA